MNILTDPRSLIIFGDFLSLIWVICIDFWALQKVLLKKYTYLTKQDFMIMVVLLQIPLLIYAAVTMNYGLRVE